MNSNWKVASIVLVAALCCGCNKEDSTNLQRDTGKLVSTASESLKNATVAVKVNTVLSMRKGVDMSGFKVESKEGIVTIKGTVRSAEEERLVLDTAFGVRGVE